MHYLLLDPLHGLIMFFKVSLRLLLVILVLMDLTVALMVIILVFAFNEIIRSQTVQDLVLLVHDINQTNFLSCIEVIFYFSFFILGIL